MVRLALVGTGWQGQGHLNTLKSVEQIQVVGVCDLNSEMLNNASHKFGITPYGNYVEMLEESIPDGVIICTPPEARIPLVKEAAERGIHCFIEKPPARDIEMATQILELLERSHVMNSVGFMYRYSPAVDYVKQVLAGKKVTLVRSQMLDGIALRANWPRWFFNKKISGGPAFDQAIHLFDLSRYILGEEIEQVAGFQDNLVVSKSDDFTVEDSFNLTMKYQNGILQNHTHTWSYDGHKTQIDFIGQAFFVTLDLGEGMVEGVIEGEKICFKADDHALYRLELEAFAKAIQEDNPESIRSTYNDSILSLRTALQVVKALESGQVVNGIY